MTHNENVEDLIRISNLQTSRPNIMDANQLSDALKQQQHMYVILTLNYNDSRSKLPLCSLGKLHKYSNE